MAAIATGLILIGSILVLVGWIMVLIGAFSESVLWGLGSVLIPIVWLIFAIMHWGQSKKGFLIYLGGFVLMIVGVVLGGAAGMHHAQ